MSAQSGGGGGGGGPPSEQASHPYAGCEHYKRLCQLKCPTCETYFACRFCHDALMNENPKVAVEKRHPLDRKAVKSVMCMACGLEQVPGRECSGCGVVLGNYFCGICNLYDHEDKGQYHCDGCGMCRVNKGRFVHCEGCNTCVSKEVKETHRCIPSAMRSACPVCQEDIFTSRKQSQLLGCCGHYMHSECYASLRLSSEKIKKCPLCQQCLCDHSRVWAELDTEVRWRLLLLLLLLSLKSTLLPPWHH